MKTLNKVIRPGRVDCGRLVNLFCKIEISEDGKLSITGVEGPKSNGDAWGSCGQIEMGYKHRNPAHDDKRYSKPTTIAQYADGWTAEKWFDFLDVWHKWHLNDMRVGSPSQEAWLESNPIPKEEYAYPKSHYEVASEKLAAAGLNPDASGYRYGHSWRKEELPAEVVEFLKSLPETDETPAWV